MVNAPHLTGYRTSRKSHEVIKINKPPCRQLSGLNPVAQAKEIKKSIQCNSIRESRAVYFAIFAFPHVAAFFPFSMISSSLPRRVRFPNAKNKTRRHITKARAIWVQFPLWALVVYLLPFFMERRQAIGVFCNILNNSLSSFLVRQAAKGKTGKS